MKDKTIVTKSLVAALMLLLCTGLSSARIVPGRVTLNAAIDKPVMLVGQGQTAYIKIGLTGCPMESCLKRPPVNIAIVIDKSGSMSGEKIEKAKEAAIMAVNRLNCEDIVSVVTYDSNIRVIVPATKVADKHTICSKIRHIRAGGSTALYGGVQKGAAEMRKFACTNRVNRMLLLSDGLANVGPQSPEALGDLGAALISDGISVTTIGIGLGYNEDLMTQLAYKSDGSHYFAEQACELADIFNRELGRALAVVAQEVNIEIKCAPGVRPVRLLGRDGTISGRTAKLFINQLYSQHEKYAILEVEVEPASRKKRKHIADVNITYGNMITSATDKLHTDVVARFSDSEAVVEKSLNESVTIDVIKQIATERNELAVTLRDKGKISEAKKVLKANSAYLNSNAAKFECEDLAEFGRQNEADSSSLEGAGWNRRRKTMRYRQSAARQQN